jgi:fructokinase
METVSTIGAGDNFNAGFLYGLIKNHISRDDMERGLTEEQWDAVIGCAQQFSAEACRTLNNYVSPEFGVQRQQELAEALAQEEI